MSKGDYLELNNYVAGDEPTADIGLEVGVNVQFNANTPYLKRVLYMPKIYEGVRMFVAELMASIFFYFMVYLASSFSYPLNILAGLIEGLALFVVMVTFSPESSGHANPGYTFAWMIAGRGPWIMGLIYMLIAQPLGSLVAIGMLRGIFDDNSFVYQVNKLGTPMLNEFLLTENEGFAVETFGCTILFCVVLFSNLFSANTYLGSEIAPRANSNAKPESVLVGRPADYAAAISGGFTLAVLVFGAIFLTGGSYNVYRWLWPAVFSTFINDPDVNAWIYIVPGLVGAIIAGLIVLGYSYLLNMKMGKHKKSKQSKN